MKFFSVALNAQDFEKKKKKKNNESGNKMTCLIDTGNKIIQVEDVKPYFSLKR